MESATLALVLALTLACTGVMFLLISKQIGASTGMPTFALGLALFGVSFAVPASVDRAATLVQGVGIDVITVAGVLLLRRGLQAFMGRSELGWPAFGGALAAFALLSAAARARWGTDGRELALVLALGLLFAWIALGAARDARSHDPRLRMPLILLALVLGVLSLLSLGQAATALAGPATPASAAGMASERIYEVALMLSALLLGPTLLWLHSTQLSRQLGELATRDPLTRLLNEAGLEDVVQRHFQRGQHDPLALILIDVDQFARVNAQHGHTAGDNVLRLVSLALESSLRAGDFVARVAGEEFVVGCVCTGIGQAAVAAERMRDAVAAIQTGLTSDGHPVRVTVSLGLSRPIDDLEKWREAWDEAELSLQAAKDAGRNCVVHPTVAAVAA